MNNSTAIDLDQYRRLRAASKRLISKLYDVAKAPQFDIIKTAKKLTIPVHERTLILDGETDTNALADFYLHEMRFAGKRVVDLLADSASELPPEERASLAAHRAASCSLFEIRAVDPDSCQLQLHDLLEPNAPNFALTDISLSNCAATKEADLLFTRVIRCDGFNYSAGLFFAFRAYHRDALLKEYEERMWSVEEKERPQRKYIFFYRRNRELGLDQAYRDVA